MALLDDLEDPALASQLYGAPPASLADALPPPSTVDPWAWVPDEWNTQPEAAPESVAPAGAPDLPGAVPGGPAIVPIETAAAPALAPVDPAVAAVPEAATAAVPTGIPGAPAPIGADAGPVLGPPDVTAPNPLAGTPFDTSPANPLFGFPAPALPPPKAIDVGGGQLAAGAPQTYPAELPPAELPFGPQPPSRVASLPDFTIHTETNAEKYATHPWDNPNEAERDAAARHLALTDPEGFSRYVTHLAAAKESARAAESSRIEAENLQKANENVAALQRASAAAQAKTDQIAAESQHLTSRALDRKRWFRNLSTAGKIATVINALVGGLVSKPGGPNLGADFITKHIDDDINDQKADIENQRASLADRRSAVAQEFARTGDLLHATEVVRLASYNAALHDLQTVQQNFDPRGTSFAEIGQQAQAMQARIAAAKENVRKTAFDEEIKAEQLRQTNAVNAESRRHNRVEESIAWTREGREASKDQSDKTVWSPDQLKVLNPGQAVPPIPMTLKAYGQWIETQKTGEQHKNAALQNNPDERNRELAVGGVLDSKSEPVRFRSTEIAGHVAQGKEDAEEIVRLTDELAGMIRKNGWQSDLWKSPEWRKATSNYNSIIIRKKEQDKLGVLTGPDVEIVTGEIGSKNPTEARNPLPGLEQFRHNVVEGFNAKLRAQAVLPDGRTVQRWDPVAPPTEAAAADKLSGKTFGAAIDESEPGAIRKGLDLRSLSPEGTAGVARDAARAADRSAQVGPTGLAPEDTTKVAAAIKATRTGTPEARAAAVGRLVTWASSDRPDITSGVLGLIQAENPDLYATVLAQLPEHLRDDRADTDAIGAALRAQVAPIELPPPPPTKRKGR
jgi:hypothetical protein